MKFKFLLLISALIMGSFSLKAEKIPVIVKDSTSPFWQIVLDGGCTAGVELGIEVPLLGPTSESDIAGQINVLEDAVNSGADAIVIAATSFEGLGGPIDEAAKKVPVVVIDSIADSKNHSTFMTTNNVEGGRMGCQYLVDIIAEKHGAPEGEVAIVNYGAGPSSLRDRIQGCNEVFDSYPDIKLVATKIGDFTTTRQLNDTLDLITTFPNLRGIFDDALFGGLGTGQALSETGKAGEILAVTFDSSDELINMINEGTLQGLIIQDPWGMGNMGVKSALDAVNGKSLPSFTDTGATLVTKANINDAAVDAKLNPSLDCKP
jgi:ribose transport system substrate-binding protein